MRKILVLLLFSIDPFSNANANSLSNTVDVIRLLGSVSSLSTNPSAAQLQESMRQAEKEKIKTIKTTYSADDVAHCKKISAIEITFRPELWQIKESCDQYYMELKKKSLELGANTLFLFVSSEKPKCPTQAMAYSCPSQKH